MSIYRSGHVTTGFITPNNQPGLQYCGGNGKIAPEIISATTKRLHATVSAVTSSIPTIPNDKNTLNIEQTFDYSYTHPVVSVMTEQNIQNLINFGAYQPLSREHSIAHTITTPQLPPFLYLYIIQSLQQHYKQSIEKYQNDEKICSNLNQNDQNFPGLNTIFSTIYAGRQSPTVILGDLWLHYRLDDLWIQTITHGAQIEFKQEKRNENDHYLYENELFLSSKMNISTFEQSQLFIFSLPNYNNDKNNIITSKHCNYNHYLIVGSNFEIFKIQFSTPLTSQMLDIYQIKDEIPTIYITGIVSPKEMGLLLPGIDLQGLFSGSSDEVVRMTSDIVKSIVSNLNIPETIISSMGLIVSIKSILDNQITIQENNGNDENNQIPENNTKNTPTFRSIPNLQLGTTLPLPRYKAASAAIGSKMYIHGGRAGFALNYRKSMIDQNLLKNDNDGKDQNDQNLSKNDQNLSKNDQNNKTIQQSLTPSQLSHSSILCDDAVMIESILPLTPPKAIALVNKPTTGQPISPNPATGQPISPNSTQSTHSTNTNSQNEQQQQQQQQQPDPTYVSLILNDLWELDFGLYPYKWTRIDTKFTENGQNIPSHRFGHAATIISTTSLIKKVEICQNDDNLNENQKEMDKTYLVIHGGLRLNHDRCLEKYDNSCSDGVDCSEDLEITQKNTEKNQENEKNIITKQPTPKNSNNNNNDNTSSYHKALISSPTLFFLDITSLMMDKNETNHQNDEKLVQNDQQKLSKSLKSFHFTPPLALNKPHHTDVSDQIILPPSIQIGQRPFDLYGHQLISISFENNSPKIQQNDDKNLDTNNNPTNTKIVILAIGGTSHTCLAAASIMALEIDPALLQSGDKMNQNCDNKVEENNEHIHKNEDKILEIYNESSLYWSPIHQPIEDALFIRHTSTITSLPHPTTLLQQHQYHCQQQQQQQQQDTPIQITTIGGGALCFSFGTYYSPTMNLNIHYCGPNNGYSPLTSLLATITQPSFNCLTPASFPLQHIFQQQAIGAGVQNITKQMNKQKQNQERRKRDNHTVLDISKDIKGQPQICIICQKEFESKNKLFKHITITGHKRVE